MITIADVRAGTGVICAQVRLSSLAWYRNNAEKNDICFLSPHLFFKCECKAVSISAGAVSSPPALPVGARAWLFHPLWVLHRCGTAPSGERALLRLQGLDVGPQLLRGEAWLCHEPDPAAGSLSITSPWGGCRRRPGPRGGPHFPG